MKKLILGVLIVGIFSGCGPADKKENDQPQMTNIEEARKNIAEMEEELNKKMRTRFDDKLAATLVDFYKTYASNNPQDSLTPEYLFKAGEVSIGLRKYEDAIGNFERIYKHYKDFNKRVESLYLVGFVYDEHMDQYGKAKEYYQKVLNNHPDHPFADDAEASIETLGMTDEEIIKRFEEMQKSQAQAQ